MLREVAFVKKESSFVERYRDGKKNNTLIFKNIALLVQEADDIGITLFRLDLYPDSIHQQFRTDFKKYIIARIDYYKGGNYENNFRVP